MKYYNELTTQQQIEFINGFVSTPISPDFLGKYFSGYNPLLNKVGDRFQLTFSDFDELIVGASFS